MEVAIGIDIGGTNTKFSWVDREGNVLTTARYKTKTFPEASLLVDAIAERMLPQRKKNWDLIGVGVGAPNGNYFKGTIEFAPNLEWKGVVPLAELFEAKFNVPVFVTNDANASAIGEMIYGSAKWMKDFVQVTLGTGVGSGFVVNGEILYGHDGFAGELGHVIVKPGGRKCGCGRKGCLETYTSATGIVRTLKKYIEDEPYQFSPLKEIQNINSYDIFKAAESGDELALKIFDYTARKLGFALANVVAITSPEAIFLFGGLAQAGDLILKPTKKYMEKYMLQVFKNKVKILPSGLEGAQASILGAAALVWQNTRTNETVV